MPNRQKIEVAEKVRIARECLEHKLSIREAARLAGANCQSIRNWISIYENYGVEGFTPKGNQHFTTEVKMAAVIEYLNGDEGLYEYPDCSLADLYDEATMPPELRRAHQQNDKAVMQAYGFDVKTTTEASCVAELMKLYQKLTGASNESE